MKRFVVFTLRWRARLCGWFNVPLLGKALAFPFWVAGLPNGNGRKTARTHLIVNRGLVPTRFTLLWRVNVFTTKIASARITALAGGKDMEKQETKVIAIRLRMDDYLLLEALGETFHKTPSTIIKELLRVAFDMAKNTTGISGETARTIAGNSGDNNGDI